MQKKSKFYVFTFMMLIIIALTLQPTISSYAVCPDDISSYWKLDETPAGPYTDFINGKNGLGNAAPAPEPTGKVNGAQRFDGSTTGIDVAPDRDFNWHSDESFSIEFWVKTGGGTPLNNEVVIGRDDAASDFHWWVGITGGAGTVAFVLRDHAGAEAALAGTTNIADGAWHHVVAVRDDSTDDNILYVDNVEEDRADPIVNYLEGFGSNDANLNIGWLNLGPSFFHFDGFIDEVAIYDRALALSEIESHFNAAAGEDYCEGSAAPVDPGDAPFPDDTISLWHLDETVGPNYADAFDGNNGIGNVDPAAEANGQVGGAQRFDGFTGTAGIDVASSRSFDWLSTNSFSIEFWVKTDGVVAPGTNQVVIGRDDAATGLHWWVGLNATDGLPSFFLIDTSGNGATIAGAGSVSLSDGSWHHVVAVRDGSTGFNHVYVDGGDPQGSAPFDYTGGFGFGSNNAGINIGYLNHPSVFRFDGFVDEVALYDRALTKEEIQDHYDAGFEGDGVTTLRPAPDANAGLDQDVTEGAPVTLNGGASTAGYAAAPLSTYVWEQTAGTAVTINNDTATSMATFTAPPDVAAAGETLTFQLTVTASDGQSDIDSVDVGVVDSPVADAGVPQNVTEGAPVTLDGSGSTGRNIAYAWTQTDGTEVTINNDTATPTATFTAPDVAAPAETLTFQLMVTDDVGATSTETVDVNVADASGPLLANAGPDQTVTVGAPVTLDGTASTGPVDSYEWIQTAGTLVQLVGSDTATPTFTAPRASDITAAVLDTLTFQLTVEDNTGLESIDTVSVNVDDGRGGGGGGGGGCFINSMF